MTSFDVGVLDPFPCLVVFKLFWLFVDKVVLSNALSDVGFFEQHSEVGG